MTTSHVFVYQEWDMQREKAPIVEERLERVQQHQHINLARSSNFATQMQEGRIRQRMTIAELAEKCALDTRRMTLFESGAEMPTADVQARILQTLDIDTSS